MNYVTSLEKRKNIISSLNIYFRFSYLMLVSFFTHCLVMNTCNKLGTKIKGHQIELYHLTVIIYGLVF